MPAPTTAGAERGRGPRAHIVALVASALLPAFAVGAIAVGAAVGSYRRAFEDRLEGTAGALASAVGSEIDTYVVALSTLAVSRGRDPDGDLSAFHERATQAASVLRSRVFLVMPDLSSALHTHFAADADLRREPPRRQSEEAVRRVFETGRPAVGDLVHGQVTGHPVAPVYVPVHRDGKTVYAFGAAMEAGRISRLLAEQPFRDGGYASLLDGKGRILARSAEQERFVGQRVRDWVVEGTIGARSGVLRGENLSGAKTTMAFRHVPGTPGWMAVVAEPEAAYHANLRQPLATLALGGLGALALSCSSPPRSEGASSGRWTG